MCIRKGNLVEYIKKTVWSEAKRGRYLGQVGSGMAGMSSKNSSDNGESKNSDSIDEGENDSISDFGSENEDDVEFEPEMENNLKISKFGGTEGKGIDADNLRREKNRMHAKLTRDKKKLFTSRIQQMIKYLEGQNSFMRSRLHGAMRRFSTYFDHIIFVLFSSLLFPLVLLRLCPSTFFLCLRTWQYPLPLMPILISCCAISPIQLRRIHRR